ncbi:MULTISPECIES: hypothetical protein [Pseudoalteromonas]|uniref:DUF5625 domain-containing protein n=1 Tax=Pseudoalteromonas amylolytica TaxID=1859457 RepID=A0A1S1N1F5_9GAMM|nr:MULTISPECIES: hypothetical protein [Pseudoalteromonas]MCF6436386.1 hypothetical protein [Pseudoalteromonas sp. MMG022]OHU91883.1 hypothetical protein BFC16_01965 [Pseudoalteromonas sp. JW3]OHU93217.1 hypothetical protein BET10_01875 [Pseudoalteromonas amylolytica]
MKKLIIVSSLLTASQAFAAPVDVGGVAYELGFNDFEPITVPYAGREAVVAYEAKFAMDGDFGQNLNYRVDGLVYTRWFSGNMAATLSVTCNSPYIDEPIFIGEDMDFGIRIDGVSYLAKPAISSYLNTGGNCQELTVRIDKEGHLSRQFYTRVTDLQFNVQVIETIPR